MRIAVAEGSAILRAGLAQVLRDHGHELVATVHDARVLPALISTHRPDVLIANVRLAPSWSDEGIEAALDARRQRPGTGALIFSQSPDTDHVARLFAGNGAGLGYLLHDRMMDAGELTDSLTRVATGGTVVDPRVVGTLAAATALPGQSGPASGIDELSERELEVLALIARGRTNSAIAKELCIARGTVEKRVAAVFDKLGIPCTAHDNRRVLAALRYPATRP
ncbi:response regulator transcription factor, partial [Streptomyces sp. A7024]